MVKKKKSASLIYCQGFCNLRAEDLTGEGRGGWLRFVQRVKSHDMNMLREAPPVCTVYLKG